MPDDTSDTPTLMHERFGTDGTDDGVTEALAEPEQITDQDILRRVLRTLDTATQVERTCSLVARVLRGDLDADELWSKVDGLPGNGIVGTPQPDPLTYALHRIRLQAHLIEERAREAYHQRRVQQALQDDD